MTAAISAVILTSALGAPPRNPQSPPTKPAKGGSAKPTTQRPQHGTPHGKTPRGGSGKPTTQRPARTGGQGEETSYEPGKLNSGYVKSIIGSEKPSGFVFHTDEGKEFELDGKTTGLFIDGAACPFIADARKLVNQHVHVEVAGDRGAKVAKRVWDDESWKRYLDTFKSVQSGTVKFSDAHGIVISSTQTTFGSIRWGITNARDTTYYPKAKAGQGTHEWGSTGGSFRVGMKVWIKFETASGEPVAAKVSDAAEYVGGSSVNVEGIERGPKVPPKKPNLKKPVKRAPGRVGGQP